MKKVPAITRIVIFCMMAFLVCSCSKDEKEADVISGCGTEGLMESFTDAEGNHLFIYEDGSVYAESYTDCTFELQYFDTNFLSDNYISNTSGTFLIDEGDMTLVKNNFITDFETTDTFLEIFKTDLNDPELYWTNFTLQSPMAKEVSSYVALNKCILNGSCDFLDNRIDQIPDPLNADNQVLRFSSVAPTADMVTAKCSLTSVLSYFNKGDDLWFEADYYIDSGMPYSLVDFESSYFKGSPGPRVVIKDGRLALENKFGEKLVYSSATATPVPLGTWFTIKVHLTLSNTNDGVLQLWQDDALIISSEGINLQTANGLQNILEVGISATQEATTLLMDNIRISDTAFQ